jgi:hypothetical protein
MTIKAKKATKKELADAEYTVKLMAFDDHPNVNRVQTRTLMRHIRYLEQQLAAARADEWEALQEEREQLEAENASLRAELEQAREALEKAKGALLHITAEDGLLLELYGDCDKGWESNLGFYEWVMSEHPEYLVAYEALARLPAPEPEASDDD